MTTPDPKDREIAELRDRLRRLEQAVDYLTRENNRRKNEINQLANAIRRG